MTVEECLLDELQYLNEKLSFFKKINYWVMIVDLEKRISKVEAKIKSLDQLPEKVY